MVNATTKLVPRSGSTTISRQAGPATTAIGATAWRKLCMRFGWSARYRAAYRTSASFMSSDGWNWIGPAENQRRAPFTTTPKPGTSTSRSSANEPSRSAFTSRGVKISSPRRASTCIAARPPAPNTR